MKPYIFLTENYLKNVQDSNAQAVSITRLQNITPPYEATIYFTDRYGTVVNRTIDTLILQNSNVANMKIEALDSQGNPSPLFTLENNASSTVISNVEDNNNAAGAPIWVNDMSVQPISRGVNLEFLLGFPNQSVLVKNVAFNTTSAIKITIPATGNPASVNIGHLGIYGFICNLFALTDSNYKKDTNQGGYRTVDGSYIHWADYKKWVAKIKMENLAQGQFNELTAQADTGEMTVIPYQDLEFDEIYECAVGTDYSYGLDRKTELFNLELELNEL